MPRPSRWGTSYHVAQRSVANHSLLRHVLFFTAYGTGAAGELLRHAFLHLEQAAAPVGDVKPTSLPMAHAILKTLSSAPDDCVPLSPRVLLADAFQELLAGSLSQRHVRERFEAAALNARCVLMEREPDAPPPDRYFVGIGRSEEEVMRERIAWEMAQFSPLHRLWMYELYGIAAYWEQFLAIPPPGSPSAAAAAAVVLYGIVAADVRRDKLLTTAVLEWEGAVQAGAADSEVGSRRGFGSSVVNWWHRRKRLSAREAEVAAYHEANVECFQVWREMKQHGVKQRCTSLSGGATETGGPAKKEQVHQAEAAGDILTSLVYDYSHPSIISSDPSHPNHSYPYHLLPPHSHFMHELLVLERDCFGVHRFSSRGDIQYLAHVLRLEDVGKTWSSASLLFHPVMITAGNLDVTVMPIANQRWVRMGVRCGEEDHRLLPEHLPLVEDVSVDGGQTQLRVRYDEPIILSPQAGKSLEMKSSPGAKRHVETFDLAVDSCLPGTDPRV